MSERKIRLSQVMKEFNVGLTTVVEFLQKRGVEIDSAPNALVLPEVYAILEKEYGEAITSSTAADRLFMSHAYFCRRFRSAFGLRFMEYLAMYRVEKSKPLLLRTERPISEIAMLVGFKSFSHFTKIFRSHVGVPPSAYRAGKR